MHWRIEHRPETGSTNADVIEAARAGAEEGLVITADAQTAGRGRLGRTWLSQPGDGLALSLLLRPKLPVAKWGWLPLLTGIALADTVTDAGVDCGLKWPNDLLIAGEDGDRKCAGILAEAAVSGAVVIGVGVNLRDAPPGLNAISLREAGAQSLDIMKPLLDRFAEYYDAWQGGADLRETYLQRCRTIRKRVKVVLPGDAELAGEAITVDPEGRLVIRDIRGELCPIAAGDVTHVR